ncbi:2-oxoacid:acceptor oxidoreductase family protein [Methylotuvimicrobium sp.]|uniref:2-oxoacid:acceptor oxidoreductase family protein n=1 Tax=Methylotuvimicrobium sp. TaxID=2822413 RepID=UPI003D65C975
MFNIRFHGRGGQGIKTAGRLLGTAFFLEGYEVQDAPRYGAERRGAPMSAYVRADRKPINARGIITHPDLVVVVDDSLIPVPAAGVLAGIRPDTVLLIASHEDDAVWRSRLNLKSPILTIKPSEGADPASVSAACAGASARLTGVIRKENLIEALEDELGKLGPALLKANLDTVLQGFESMSAHQGLVRQSEAIALIDYQKPEWINLPLEASELASATIQGAQTSVQVRTGLWRTQRPVVHYEDCHRCWWVCSSFCPDSAISVNEEGFPVIDYEHCKGCMICVAQCPSHAIVAIPESEAQRLERQGEQR